ncbi:O-acetyl-ADP-ribose deacetylase (regulator of RNase III), contains Macro domain [Salinimicrobium sediminis]|uniref:O-acetyl-ADP-ribose deacetylase (Regulator of RNase III), contains Macro domain n=1 Tax=Salinimicrobium sediminis TaxID=1343891 RepID=A0A285X7H6_9FLAO|nr:macro domain-containing protein [Salinimicrobium sediminis]SOC81238.1 O-acetyl-ADP-ribose deacetylase (regulator of RNase III), contains Macro domain [Salinimicrobium sediminis]
MKRKISGVTIELRKGDITRQKDCEAVVNAANARLQTGGGVAGAIHKAAGPQLEKEAVPLGPLEPGEAVITGAFELPNRYVIHCLGPVYGKDKPEAELLANCYSNALDLAEEHRLPSIAFPAISTGIFGYPIEEAARVAITTIIGKITEIKHLKNIVFVLYSSKDLEVYEKILEQILQGKEYLG